MDIKTKKILSSWGPMAGIFLIIAIACVWSMFAPVKVVTSDNEISYGPLSARGAVLVNESWHKYPNYIAGLGAGAFLSLYGLTLSIYNMHKANQS